MRPALPSSLRLCRLGQVQQLVLDPLAPAVAHFGVVLGVRDLVGVGDHILVDREVVLHRQQFVDQLDALVDPLRNLLKTM